MWKALFIGLLLSASVFSLSGTKKEGPGDAFGYEVPPTLKLLLVFLQEQKQEQEKKEAADAEKRAKINSEIDRFLASGRRGDNVNNIVQEESG